MKKHILLIVIIAIGGTALPAAASMYAGASIGNSFFSSEFADATDKITEIDENSTAWKIFGGFRSDSFFNIEGGYRDFGKIESGSGSDLVTSKTTGWDIDLMGRIQVAFLDVFGKAGVIFTKTEVSILGFPADETNTEFMWGLGAGARLGPIGVRLEWESVALSGVDNLSMVSLGATFGF
jgi:OmpA-OmpF porin, OOP family